MILREEGLDPVLQMVTRDRNRIALQSDVLGASALGIRNILCLSGDHQSLGNQPGAKGVFDLDSMQLLQVVRQMRDKGVILGGDQLSSMPDALHRRRGEPLWRPAAATGSRGSRKRCAPGPSSSRPSASTTWPAFESSWRRCATRALTSKVFILGGITPLKSVRMAEYMAEQRGGHGHTGDVIDRLKGVPAKEQRQEGIKIAVETIQALKEIKGVRGVHIMAIEWEEAVPELVEKAGLLPRPEAREEELCRQNTILTPSLCPTGSLP